MSTTRRAFIGVIRTKRAAREGSRLVAEQRLAAGAVAPALSDTVLSIVAGAAKQK